MPLGAHLAESRVRLTGNFNLPESQSGFRFGSGTEIEEINFQCPLIVGAPQASWEIAAYSDFSENKGMFKDNPNNNQNVVTEGLEGENGVYQLSIDVNDYALDDQLYGISRSPEGLPLLSDLVFSVDQEIRSKAKEAVIGLEIRLQADGSRYILEIHPETQNVMFNVVPKGSNETSILWESQSQFVNTTGKNPITLIANGSNFTAQVNQYFLFFIEDSSTPDPGIASIYNLASGYGKTEFIIDNLLIRAPIE